MNLASGAELGFEAQCPRLKNMRGVGIELDASVIAVAQQRDRCTRLGGGEPRWYWNQFALLPGYLRNLR